MGVEIKKSDQGKWFATGNINKPFQKHLLKQLQDKTLEEIKVDYPEFWDTQISKTDPMKTMYVEIKQDTPDGK